MVQLITSVALTLGYLARGVLMLSRVAMFSAGPLLVVYGVQLIYRPAAYIVTGLIVFSLFLFLNRPSEGGK